MFHASFCPQNKSIDFNHTSPLQMLSWFYNCSTSTFQMVQNYLVTCTITIPINPTQHLKCGCLYCRKFFQNQVRIS